MAEGAAAHTTHNLFLLLAISMSGSLAVEQDDNRKAGTKLEYSM